MVGPEIVLTREQLRTFAAVCVSVLRYIDGAWSLEPHRENALRWQLDQLASLHGLPTLAQKEPYRATVRVFIEGGDPRIVDVDRICADIAAHYPRSDCFFDLRVLQVKGDSVVSAWLVPGTSLDDLKAMADFDRHRLNIPDDVDPGHYRMPRVAPAASCHFHVPCRPPTRNERTPSIFDALRTGGPKDNRASLPAAAGSRSPALQRAQAGVATGALRGQQWSLNAGQRASRTHRRLLPSPLRSQRACWRLAVLPAAEQQRPHLRSHVPAPSCSGASATPMSDRCDVGARFVVAAQRTTDTRKCAHRVDASCRR